MQLDPIVIIPTSAGLDNYHAETAGVFQPAIAAGDAVVVKAEAPPRLKVATNVDVGKEGELETRSGYAARRVLTAGQAVFEVHGNLYYQNQGVLYKDALVPVTLVSGLARAATVIPTHTGFFVSDGVIHKQVVGDLVYTWGQAAPVITLTGVAGALPAGIYLVQASFTDLQGNEGPVCDISSASVNGSQAIQFNTTIPSTSAAVNIYISSADQPELNFLISRSAGQLPYTITSAAATVSAPPVTDQMIGPISGLTGGCNFRSFVLLWRDNFVIRSEAHEPHLYHPENIMQFPSTVTWCCGVDDGIWVGTESGLWWVTGEDPSTFVPFKKTDSYVLRGGIQLEGMSMPAARLIGQLAVFATREGLIACGATGQYTWLTKEHYTFAGTAATFGFATRNGQRQLFVVT